MTPLSVDYPSWLAPGHSDEDEGPHYRNCKRGRRMPSLWKIASYWAERDTFAIDITEPECLACGVTPIGDTARRMEGLEGRDRWNAALGFIERAHLVDHCDGGLDAVQNLVPLCAYCHRRKMPEFRCGTGRWAIAWVQGGGKWEMLPYYLDRPTRAFTCGGISWERYVHHCWMRTGLDWHEAAECAEAINFTGRGIDWHQKAV